MHKRQLFSFAIGVTLISVAPIAAVAQTASTSAGSFQSKIPEVDPILLTSSSGQASVQVGFHLSLDRAANLHLNSNPNPSLNLHPSPNPSPSSTYRDLLTWNQELQALQASVVPPIRLGTSQLSPQTNTRTTPAKEFTRKTTVLVSAISAPLKRTGAHKTTVPNIHVVVSTRQAVIHKSTPENIPKVSSPPASTHLVSHSLPSIRGQQIASYAT